jgi:hypothetical protein
MYTLMKQIDLLVAGGGNREFQYSRYLYGNFRLNSKRDLPQKNAGDQNVVAELVVVTDALHLYVNS